MTPSHADHTPQRVIGRYALFDEIGAGGMATVHLGRLLGPQGFSRTVAIKRLHANFAKDPEFAEMFLDEARLAARIQHPNVIPTLDVVTNDGELYLVMEYVQGESLARLRRESVGRGEKVPYRIAVAVMINVLNGLHAAHEAKSERGEPLGIVHRDVSPHNVLVGIDGVARVLDFGVAKAVWKQQTTREGQLKGKLAYMAPEQFDAKPIDRRVDVYAAAVTLWEILVGRRLFDAESPLHVMSMITSMPVKPPGLLVHGIPRELDDVVLRGLTRNRDERYPTARAMAIALEGLGIAASQREVGEWVEKIAGDTLHNRARKVAEVEGVSTIIARPSAKWAAEKKADAEPSAPALVQESAAPLQAMQAFTSSTAMAVVAPRSHALSYVIVGASAILALVVAVMIASQEPLARAAPITAPIVTSAFELAQDANAQAAAAAATTAHTPAPPTTSVPEETPPPPPPAPPPKAAAPAPAPKPAKPAPRGECSPPYTVDAQGIRHPKVQCL